MSSKANSSFSRTTLFPEVTLLSYWNLAWCMLQAAGRLHTHRRVSPPVVSFIVSLCMAASSHREHTHPVTTTALRKTRHSYTLLDLECETVRAGHF
jgi:hypothetical protein